MTKRGEIPAVSRGYHFPLYFTNLTRTQSFVIARPSAKNQSSIDCLRMSRIYHYSFFPEYFTNTGVRQHPWRCKYITNTDVKITGGQIDTSRILVYYIPGSVHDTLRILIHLTGAPFNPHHIHRYIIHQFFYYPHHVC